MSYKAISNRLVLVPLLLIIGGLLGNYFTIPLFFGADFLFGSIAVLLVLNFYGLTWGLFAAVILSARSGEEAIELYKENTRGIDLVILDMIMPGMSGAETYTVLREMDLRVKVILSSGYSMNDQALSIMKRGCNGFIQKPFSVSDLSKKVREVLESDNGQEKKETGTSRE